MVNVASVSRVLRAKWRLLASIVAIPLFLLFALAAFPWGYVAPRAAGALSRALGREVTIAGAHRLDHFSLVPTVVLTGVRIGQPAWAGPGPLAEIAEARVRFAALPLLLGRFSPHALDLSGVDLHLLRAADGRSNWQNGRHAPGTARPPQIAHLTIARGTLHLIDRRGSLAFSGPLSADAARGLVITARGTQRGQPFAR